MTSRVLFFVLFTGTGFAILKYTLQWVSMVGKSQWAEQHLGGGGSFTMWKLIGVILVVFGFFSLFGLVNLFPEKSVIPDNATGFETQINNSGL